MSEDIYLRKPVNALISFHYFKTRDVAEIQSWGLRLIGDSGAYSAESQGAPIDIDEFIEWGRTWRDNLSWIASLDVIGDKEASWSNYRYLRDAQLDVIPTIHYGCDPSEMDRYAAEGVDFMGLGGMVIRKSETPRLLRWTLSCFHYARENHPQMRFHGWGVTHKELVNNLPWFSVDSSGYSSSYRFARLSLFDPSIGKNVGIDLNGRDIFKHNDLLQREYGIDPAEVAVSDKESRRQLVRLSIASIQRQEDFLRKRHTVIAPSYGLNPLVENAPPELYASVGRNPLDLKNLGPTSPSIHAALGFPGAQSTISLNPDDVAPRIHIASAAPVYMAEIGDISISPTQKPQTKEA